MNRLPESAAILLRKAREDLQTLEVLIGSGKAPASSTGFHAQQAAEKAIKAVLSHQNVVFPRTHNLRVLVSLLPGGAASLPPDAELLPRLTPFGVVMRYDEVEETEDLLPDQGQLLTVVRRTLDWAEGILRVGNT
jgi:HEPN domain-containing protein